MDEITQILMQAPFLALFLWYVNQQNKRADKMREEQEMRWDGNNKEWRLYLSERNGKLEAALKEIADRCGKKS